jgi:H+/gluconate symporter-like permease
MPIAADAPHSDNNSVLILKTWSVMETIISVVGLLSVLLLNLVL